MGSSSIVQPPPLLDEDNGLGERVVDLSAQELIPQLAVEAFVVTVLPWTTWFNEDGIFDTLMQVNANVIASVG